MPGTATTLPVAGLAPLGTRERAGNLLTQVGEPCAAPPPEIRLPEDQPGVRGTFGPGRALGLEPCPRDYRGASATGVTRVPAGFSRSRRGATETRSRDRVQPAAGSFGGPSRSLSLSRISGSPPAPSRLTWQVGRAGGGKRWPAGGAARRPGAKCRWRRGRLGWLGLAWAVRFNSSAAAASCLPAGPPALPGEEAAEAPLPLRVSQVSSRRRRRQGRGRIPRLRASPAPRPGPT